MNIPEKRRVNPLQESLRAKADALISQCTGCGRCYEACPMKRHATTQSNGKDVVSGILKLLRGEESNAAALAWTVICTKSAICVPACPEGLDPLMMVRLAKIASFGGFGFPAQATSREDPLYFARTKAYAQLQLEPEEYEKWLL